MNVCLDVTMLVPNAKKIQANHRNINCDAQGNVQIINWEQNLYLKLD